MLSVKTKASIDIGLGTSSFTYGRAIPSLNVAYASTKWSVIFQSEGVRTTIYAQNAWTIAGYKNIQQDRLGSGAASIGGGLGATYILRTYRDSLTANLEDVSEYVVGPYVTTKYEYGKFFVGFNILLGLTSKIQDHILLNFQDMSHIVFGLSL